MRKLKLLVVMLSASLTTACAPTIGIEGNAVQICRSWHAIMPSKKDVLTEGTASQIAGNNAANEKWCGTKPPYQKIAEARK